MSSLHKMPKSPHPQGFEASSSDALSTDLRDYLTRKRSVHQIALRCHCKQFISAVLFNCHCDFQTNEPLIFSLLTAISDSAKRRRSRKKKSFSDVEYLEETDNMVGLVLHQVRPKRSNWLLVQRSHMQIGLQVWRMFLSNLKGSLTHSDSHGNNCPSRL